MEQQKSRARLRRFVTLVQARDCRRRGCEQIGVAGSGLSLRVSPVGQQREIQLAVRTRQVVNFETLDLLFDFGARGQQSRHHHNRA